MLGPISVADRIAQGMGRQEAKEAYDADAAHAKANPGLWGGTGGGAIPDVQRIKPGAKLVDTTGAEVKVVQVEKVSTEGKAKEK